MSNGMLVRIVPLAGAQVTASSADAAFPAANLAHEQPKAVWQTPALSLPGSVTVDVDLIYDTSIDVVALLFGNYSAEATWEVRASTSAAGTGPLAGTGSRIFGLTGADAARANVTSRATRFHAFATGAPIARRYVRIIINETAANAEGLLRAGVVVIGQSWAPAMNFEWGGGRKVSDLSEVQQLDGGELNRWRKAKVPTVKATWGDLTAADVRALYALQLELGESEPLLLVEDPDATTGLHERIHYGTFQSLDFYERVQTEKSRAELKVRQWL